MTIKYRSKVDYKQIFDGDKQGYNLGLDASIFLKQEASPRTFQKPIIGTQGKSTGAVSASVDISAATTPTLRVAVDGQSYVTVVLVPTGLTTGLLIAAALELAVN